MQNYLWHSHSENQPIGINGPDWPAWPAWPEWPEKAYIDFVVDYNITDWEISDFYHQPPGSEVLGQLVTPEEEPIAISVTQHKTHLERNAESASPHETGVEPSLTSAQYKPEAAAHPAQKGERGDSYDDQVDYTLKRRMSCLQPSASPKRLKTAVPLDKADEDDVEKDKDEDEEEHEEEHEEEEEEEEYCSAILRLEAAVYLKKSSRVSLTRR
ncbi:hypothetical protein F4802DRAFT_603732 [Xylaria palmicola]|nr:hypothetical protein F4802DRAFT_603732 [Xylaria palmicola]